MITKENITILLGFILGTIVAAGIIFFIVIGFSMLFGVIPTNKSTEMAGSEPVGPGGGGGRISDLIEYECFINGAYYPSSSGKCSIDTSGWENTTISSLWENQTFYNNTLSPNLTNWTVPDNITPIELVVAGGGGGCPATGCSPPFNATACEIESKEWGEDCTCLSCGIWFGYATHGFFNRTGVYYDDGDPTGMTFEQMEKIENLNAKYRYSKFMAEHGVLV